MTEHTQGDTGATNAESNGNRGGPMPKCELCGYETDKLFTSPNGYQVCEQCLEGEMDPDLRLPDKEGI